MSAVLSVVGKKGSGKSKILEELIALLGQRGFRIGVVKHLSREEVEIDKPGTDTYRYRTQGAETVILAGRKRLALFSNLREEISVHEILKLLDGFDLVFLEGYFDEEFPKLEVHKKEFGDRLLTEKTESVFAVLSDEETRNGLPHFSFDQLNPLAAFIEEKLLRKELELAP